MIYVALLCIPNIPPCSSRDAGIGKYEHYPIYLSADRFPGHQNINLLLCNRQINAEFSYILKTNGAAKHLKLDCMVEGIRMWPTWIIFPGDAKNIRTMEIDLRVWDQSIAGMPAAMSDPRRCLYPAIASFVKLLRRFLKYGPLLTGIKSNDHNDVHIEALYVNIITEHHRELRSRDVEYLLWFIAHSFPHSMPPIEKLVLRKADGNSGQGTPDECVVWDLSHIPGSVDRASLLFSNRAWNVRTSTSTIC